MRFVYAADLHGHLDLYAALASLVNQTRPAALLLGGDLFPRSRDLQVQLDFGAGPLAQFFRALPVRTYAIPGNVDWPAAVAARTEPCWLDLRPTGGAVPLIGYGCVPPKGSRRLDGQRRDLAADSAGLRKPSYRTTPQGGRVDVGEQYLNELPSMEEDLLQIADGRAIWLMHAPPHGGALDLSKKGRHAGSRAVRQAIERLQPPLTLHGHIHESPALTGQWAERIGRTLAVNPGQGETLHAVVGECDGGGTVRQLAHTVYGALEDPT